MAMPDTTITKIQSGSSPRGGLGQKYLASGKTVAMRLWQQRNQAQGEESVRDYETVGFVLEGSADLHLEGQLVTLEPGDSWVVPKGARHRYDNERNFTAVEATAPPAHVHARDEQ